MSEPIWQYFNLEETIVFRVWANGRRDSCLVSAPEIQAWLAEGNTPNPYVPPPPAIPQQVPMWAVRTVLQSDGLFDQAQALIEASTDNALKNVWEYGNFADRNSAAIATLATALGLTSEQVDQMFIDANNLTV